MSTLKNKLKQEINPTIKDKAKLIGLQSRINLLGLQEIIFNEDNKDEIRLLQNKMNKIGEKYHAK